MDTVIRNIDLYGKPDGQILREINEWANDTAFKLNLMLNNGNNVSGTSNVTNIYNRPAQDTEPEEPVEQFIPEDYIVETGESAEGLCENSVTRNCICYYRKWKSGIMELWGQRMSDNVYVDVQIDSGYVSRTNYGDVQSSKIAVWGTWPVPFTDTPTVTYRLQGADQDRYSGDYEIIHSMHGYKTTSLIDPKTEAPSFAIRRDSERTYGHPVVTFYAIGHWK